MTASVRFGRRGGRWAARSTGSLAELRRRYAEGWPSRVEVDPFSVEAICAARAHEQQCGGAHKDGAPCTAVPTPEDVDAVWAGRARMAAARRAAGLLLNSTDREALARQGVRCEMGMGR